MNTEDKDLLLEEVKSFLNFTWTDEARSKRIENYILASDSYLCEVAGVESIDYTTDFLAKELLFNRVLYSDSQALVDFQENYNGMLNEFKIKHYQKVDQSDESKD